MMCRHGKGVYAQVMQARMLIPWLMLASQYIDRNDERSRARRRCEHSSPRRKLRRKFLRGRRWRRPRAVPLGRPRRRWRLQQPPLRTWGATAVRGTQRLGTVGVLACGGRGGRTRRGKLGSRQLIRGGATLADALARAANRREVGLVGATRRDAPRRHVHHRSGAARPGHSDSRLEAFDTLRAAATQALLRARLAGDRGEGRRP
mmetsp:Transcript_39569/g.104450  ORF Transcript_39569/g.104450 Transcript_39569/m.104450 type:complete len:204 (+) Transcript_39569:312-923(+)